MEANEKLAVAGFLILVLLGVGVVAYHHMERWSWTDSFYFVTSTLTTVGYGDIVPSENSRLFTGFYMIIGVPFVYFSLFMLAGSYFEKNYQRITAAQMNTLKALGNVKRITELPRYLMHPSFIKRLAEEIHSHNDIHKVHGEVLRKKGAEFSENSIESEKVPEGKNKKNKKQRRKKIN